MIGHNLGFSLFLFFSFFSSFGCCLKNTNRIENHQENKEYVHASKATVFIVVETITREGILVYSATGVSIEGDNNFSIILTAGHVCTDSIKPGTISKISITDMEGKSSIAGVLLSSLDPDVCILHTDMKIAPAELAMQEPDVGDKIYYCGYPDGLYWPGVLHHFDGRYAGKINASQPIYNFPIVGGSSGSPVYNEKGEVIGIISAVTNNFEHVGIGVSSQQIYRYIMSN
jgi:hypothetical protein